MIKVTVTRTDEVFGTRNLETVPVGHLSVARRNPGET